VTFVLFVVRNFFDHEGHEVHEGRAAKDALRKVEGGAKTKLKNLKLESRNSKQFEMTKRTQSSKPSHFGFYFSVFDSASLVCFGFRASVSDFASSMLSALRDEL
jgi:uncharacterized protein YdaU (DUF1376 family)